MKKVKPKKAQAIIFGIIVEPEYLAYLSNEELEYLSSLGLRQLEILGFSNKDAMEAIFLLNQERMSRK
jgi:hypothetical protein